MRAARLLLVASFAVMLAGSFADLPQAGGGMACCSAGGEEACCPASAHCALQPCSPVGLLARAALLPPFLVPPLSVSAAPACSGLVPFAAAGASAAAELERPDPPPRG